MEKTKRRNIHKKSVIKYKKKQSEKNKQNNNSHKYKKITKLEK